ncbi:toll/interleukin-1 receptor domain-containing protein [Amycolatopsis sp. NPDC049691]|uniref:toll/interleukin-1 receptor domain-containing protein n=1 Tax=Amycolatopsis sp. NPDC049691 TaxID=3155155 RepID=UPI00344701A6
MAKDISSHHRRTELRDSYDAAFSYSGADRGYVEATAKKCEARGVKIYYDRNETTDLWGEHSVRRLRSVFGQDAATYAIVFLSSHYLAGNYTMDELNAAIAEGIKRKGPYILPVLMHDLNVPPDLLNPAVIYLEAKDYTPDRLAKVIAEKVDRSAKRINHPGAADDPGDRDHRIRLPQIAPAHFDRQAKLNSTLKFLGQRFQLASNHLDPFEYFGEVHTTETAVNVRIKGRTSSVCELQVRRDDHFGNGRLATSFGWPKIVTTAVDGLLDATWDFEAKQARLVYVDLGATTAAQPATSFVTKYELFDLLWEKIVRLLETQGPHR